MSLLAILISLIFERFLPPLHRLRSLAWIGPYHQWMCARLADHPRWQGVPCLLVIVLLPVGGIGLAQYLLNDLLLFFGFVFSILVLTYSLGPKDRHYRVQQYLDAEDNGDTDSAQRLLEDIFADQECAAEHSTPPEEAATRARLLSEYVLVQTHEQLLAILFWFVVLGPMGAMLYRLTVELMRAECCTRGCNEPSEFQAAIQRLHYLLAWIPSRLTALSYAVMGSFVHAMHAWQNTPLEETDSHKDTTPPSHRLLVRIGLASLQFDHQPPQDNEAVRETLGLCGRSLVAWVTILALMTLAGWAS
ncbi:MAG TPA: regulatory signaling modulator protein AmpE [Gammaproteobacteria bacterium]|nr:regulatory signaling modulator protein AmpE [Gammaproteobacteria bacterium]